MENFKPVINELESRATGSDNKNLSKWLTSSANLLEALDKKNIKPSELDEELKTLRRQLDADTKPNMLRSFYTMITDSVRKKFNLTTPKYYQTLWMSIGIAAFGMPFGIVFSTVLNNYAFISIGLPIGLAIGIAIGIEKDKQAKSEGRQLDLN